MLGVEPRVGHGSWTQWPCLTAPLAKPCPFDANLVQWVAGVRVKGCVDGVQGHGWVEGNRQLILLCEAHCQSRMVGLA